MYFWEELRPDLETGLHLEVGRKVRTGEVNVSVRTLLINLPFKRLFLTARVDSASLEGTGEWRQFPRRTDIARASRLLALLVSLWKAAAPSSLLPLLSSIWVWEGV